MLVLSVTITEVIIFISLVIIVTLINWLRSAVAQIVQTRMAVLTLSDFYGFIYSVYCISPEQ